METHDRESSGSQQPFDFKSNYTSNLPAILSLLGVTLAVTSYQAQRLILLRTVKGKLDTNLIAFPRPMGIYANKNRITIGTLNQVINFQRSDISLKSVKSGYLDNLETLPAKLQNPEMTEQLQQRAAQLNAIKQADSLFTQRAALTTGMINIHDIAWGNEGLWVVNSAFSCISKLNSDYSFVACWQPPFISELVAEDRCHLNGMALLAGEPRYVTTFNQANQKDAWRTSNQLDGTLIDIKTNKILKTGLIMPHSPRCYQGLVYYCESGRGEVQSYNPSNGETKVLCVLPGFTRGMIFFGDLLIVATSKIRASKHRNKIPLDEQLGAENSRCGVWLIDVKNGEIIASVEFNGDVQQLYDIAVLPNTLVPEIIQSSDSLASHLFEFYQESMT